MIKHKIPPQIKIGATVVRVRHGGKWDKDCDTHRVFGHYAGDYHGRKMMIDSRQSESEFSSTFIHECLEVIRGINGLNLTHSTLQTLGVGLHQILEQMGVRFTK